MSRTESEGEDDFSSALDAAYVEQDKMVSEKLEGATQARGSEQTEVPEADRQWQKATLEIGSSIHDANNALSVVMGYAGIIKSEIKNPELRKEVERIENEAAVMGKINHVFLALFRNDPSPALEPSAESPSPDSAEQPAPTEPLDIEMLLVQSHSHDKPAEKMAILDRLIMKYGPELPHAVARMRERLEIIRTKDAAPSPDIVELESELESGLDMVDRNYSQVAERVPEKPRTINLKILLETVVHSKPELTLGKENAHRISITIDGDQSIYTFAPANAIEQAVSNLVVNAIKHGMGDHEKINITLSLSREVVEKAAGDLQPDSYAVITVTDDGIGINSDYLKKMREYSGFTTGGTGIGLNKIHDVTVKSGGGLEFSSAEGQGSTFKIYLPEIKVSTSKKV